MGKQGEWVKRITLPCANCNHVGVEHMINHPNPQKAEDVSCHCKKCRAEKRENPCQEFIMPK
ncbi:hypothetical protein [Candidatus Nitrosopumilus salaria]|nr:hypothetical protein [Candidatus Nitrosopumilus salaria]